MKEGRKLFIPGLFLTVLVGALVNQVLISPLVGKFMNRTAA